PEGAPAPAGLDGARPVVPGPTDDRQSRECLILGDVISGAQLARAADTDVVIWDLSAQRAWDPPIANWAYKWAVAHGVGTGGGLGRREAGPPNRGRRGTRRGGRAPTLRQWRGVSGRAGGLSPAAARSAAEAAAVEVPLKPY